MNVKRISNFFMLILISTVTLTFFLQNGVAQNHTQIGLPEGAKARIGKGVVNEIAYSPDGTRLAVGGSSGVWIYDVESGDELNLFTGHRNEVTSVSFSPDGKTVASRAGAVRLWDVDTGKIIHTFTGRTWDVTSVSFSPDGKTVASEGPNDEGTFRLWDVDTGKIIHNFITTNTGPVTSISFSPDGKTVASGSGDGTILLWDTSTGVPDTEERTVDINADGVVNIQDLVLVASRIGQSVPAGGNPVDVNGDGVINIQDLVQVAGAIGN